MDQKTCLAKFAIKKRCLQTMSLNNLNSQPAIGGKKREKEKKGEFFTNFDDVLFVWAKQNSIFVDRLG
jgi:hypothetical protein